jgi:molybdopterin-guanine dinucleotide biosynthesis protein A
MGTDKAFLELAGKPLIVRAVELAHELAVDVKIVGEPEKFAVYGAVVADVYRDRGPLGGIHAALTESEAELNLMLAVDLPFIPARFLKYLLTRAESSNATVTVPSLAGCFQPLCAAYRKQFLIPAERALANGRNKIDQLFRKVSLCTVSEEDMAVNGFNSSIFRNLNTPEDWEQAIHDFAADSH